MKEALVLETYDEVKNAMMSGKDINFEMVIIEVAKDPAFQEKLEKGLEKGKTRVREILNKVGEKANA